MSTEKFMTLDKDMLLKKRENLDKMCQQHGKVVEIITHLNKNLKKDVYVPVYENFAYFKGNITNTNECRIYLGDDYFVKTTNFKAVKIINNRKSKVESLLDEVKKQLQDLGVVIPNNNQINKIEIQNKSENNSENKNETIKEEPQNIKNLKKLSDDTFEIMEEFNESLEILEKNKPKQVNIQKEDKLNLDDKLHNLLHNRNFLTEEISEELKPINKLKTAINNEVHVISVKTEPNTKKKKDIVPLENKKVDLKKIRNIQEINEEKDLQAKRSIFYLDNELDD